MAMIQCHECNERISDSADSCPHCGAVSPFKHLKGLLHLSIIVVWIMIIAFIYGLGALLYALFGRQCRGLSPELFWHCVGGRLSDSWGSTAFLVFFVSSLVGCALFLVIDKYSN